MRKQMTDYFPSFSMLQNSAEKKYRTEASKGKSYAALQIKKGQNFVRGSGPALGEPALAGGVGLEDLLPTPIIL